LGAQLLPRWLPGPVVWQMQHHSAGGVRKPPGNHDQLASDGAGGGFGVPSEASAPEARVRLNAMAASTSQALLSAKRPDGRCASGPAIRLAKTCSMTACPRWCGSACSIGSGESVKIAWCRQPWNSSSCPAPRRGFSHRTRRTIKRPVTWSSNRCRRAPECGERHLGDLGVGDPTLLGLVEDRPAGSGSGCRRWRRLPWSPMGRAVVTLNRAPASRAAVTTARV